MNIQKLTKRYAELTREMNVLAKEGSSIKTLLFEEVSNNRGGKSIKNKYGTFYIYSQDVYEFSKNLISQEDKDLAEIKKIKARIQDRREKAIAFGRATKLDPNERLQASVSKEYKHI